MAVEPEGSASLLPKHTFGQDPWIFLLQKTDSMKYLKCLSNWDRQSTFLLGTGSITRVFLYFRKMTIFWFYLTLRRLMSYIYIYIYICMAHHFLMFLDYTQRRSTVGRTPLDE